jgi:dipeptidase E
MARRLQIVAFGGGGFSMEPGNRLLDDYVLESTGVERPRVCFVPTASGDADHYIVRFYRAFPASVCEPSHVSLFRRDKGSGIDGDVAARLLAQDLIYVGGGSVVSLLGVWRAHGLDEVLRACWQRGTVLCGLNAGSLCWFSEAITAFHAAPSASRASGCCHGRTACTTTASRAGGPSTSRASSTACARGTRPRTARRCTSSAASSTAS